MSTSIRISARIAMGLSCTLLLFNLGVWGFAIQGRRPWTSQISASVSSYGETVRFNPLAATALLSGFQGVAADLLWLKADTYWHHGQWQRLLPLYRLIVAIQPRFTLVWSMGGWHMAYNLSEMARRSSQDARRWIDEGILFLRKGLKYNQDKPDLYFDLGWTYFDKLKDYATAIPYLEKAVRKQRSVPAMKALAHAYEKAGRYPDALRIWKSLDAKGDSAAKKVMARLRQELEKGYR